MRTPIFAVAIASLLCTTAVFAAPSRPNGPAPGASGPKGVGKDVYKVRGLPAIKLAKVARSLLPKATPPASEQPWSPPTVPAITDKLELTVADPTSGAIGLAAEGALRVESVARFDAVTGYHFPVGKGKIGIWIPSTAISGLSIIMKCHGKLPSKMLVRMHEQHPGDTTDSYSMLLMELQNLSTQASFFVDVGTIGPASMVWLQLEASSDLGGQWRVDGCSIERA